MRKKTLLAVLAVATVAAATIVALVGAGVAAAGEVTGNCKNSTSAQAASNCKEDYSNGHSICSFSG